MAFRHDTVAALQALVNGNEPARARTRGHIANLNRVVSPHNVDVAARLPGLYRSRWNDNRVCALFEQHTDIDELTGPEMRIGIGESRFQVDSACGAVYGIVHKRNFSARSLPLVARY